MSVTLQVFGHVGGLIDKEEVDVGSLHRPVSVSVTGNVHRKTVTIANGANTTLYSDELGNFVLFYAVSDRTTRVVLTDTAGNSFNLPLRGTNTTGKYGVPLILGDDSTVNSNISINSVVVFNESGSSAKVKLTIIE